MTQRTTTTLSMSLVIRYLLVLAIVIASNRICTYAAQQSATTTPQIATKYSLFSRLRSQINAAVAADTPVDAPTSLIDMTKTRFEGDGMTMNQAAARSLLHLDNMDQHGHAPKVVPIVTLASAASPSISSSEYIPSSLPLSSCVSEGSSSAPSVAVSGESSQSSSEYVPSSLPESSCVSGP